MGKYALIFWWIPIATDPSAQPVQGMSHAMIGGIRMEQVQFFDTPDDCTRAQKVMDETYKDDIIVMSICASPGNPQFIIHGDVLDPDRG